MSSQPPPAGRTWKDTAATPTDAGQPWRREAEGKTPQYRKRSRLRRLLIAFALFAVACAALIWVSLWLMPADGTNVVILFAGYEDNLAVPHNVYGRNGAKALEELAASTTTPASSFWSSGNLQLRHEPRNFTDLGNWDSGLARSREKTILLYLAVHGGADPQGAYVLPEGTPAPSGTGDPSQQFLRLEKILKRLKEVPRNRNVVLVLDCTQVESCLQLGMLHNNFAAELLKLEQQIIDTPNLVVLCASDVEQRSWVSEDVGKTIFSHFLIEGLKGAADECHRGRVNAYELHKYVSDHVADWVRRNRSAEQIPILLPRKDHLGEQRAKTMHLAVVPKAYGAPPPATRPVFVPPDALVDAWKRRDRLAAQSPSPAAYAPHLWRLLQEYLLRYEDLTEAGAKDKAGSVANKITDVERAIALAQKLDLNSAGATLAMPALSQVRLPADRKTVEALNRLWDAKPEDLAKVWTEVQGQLAADKAGSELVRLKLCELVLERCAEDPAVRLDHTAGLVRALDNPLHARPAEAHFLVMLARDLLRSDPSRPTSPAQVGNDRLKPALRVRLRAERAALGLSEADRAYAYAEQVTPWLRPDVDAADKQRREGQDLLFASDKSSWDGAVQLLTEAERSYANAENQAAALRLALAQRDRVLPELPFYGEWLAARVAAVEVKSVNENALRELVKKLAPRVHTLAGLLEQRTFDGKTPEERDAKRAAHLQMVSRLAVEVKDDFDAVLKGRDEYCRDLLDADSPNGWHNVDQVLLLPSLEAGFRGQLLAKRSRLSRDLFNATLQSAPQLERFNREEYHKRVVAAAQWQGRLALAALGKPWVDQAGGAQRPGYEQLLQRLDALPAERDWRLALMQVGAEIGQRLRQLPPTIAQEQTAARQGDPAAHLRLADRWSRLIDGTGSLEMKANPAAAYRQRLVQDVLLWQAERAFFDHWYGEEATGEPYFRVAGREYLKDAIRLDAKHERLKAVEQLVAQDWKLSAALDRAPGLTAGGPAAPVLHWTSEDDFAVQFRIKGPANLVAPPGHPVVWVRTGGLVEVLSPPPEQRLAYQVEGKADFLLPCALTTSLMREAEIKAPPTPLPIDSNVVVEGLYRGQKLRLETRLQLHPVADTVVTTHPLPKTASVAVRAPAEVHREVGSSSGALAIVLDCSGSMGARKGQPVESSKWYEATEGLREVLKQLPRGTTLSVWIFGQALATADKTAKDPSETIEQILAPVVWNPEDTDAIDKLVSQARAYEPWNYSPIFRAMYTAAEKDLKHAKGYKALVVVTDGMDNHFAKDKELSGGKDTRTFLLDNFQGIDVNVLGYKMVGKEEAIAKQQFAAIEELRPPGKFYELADARKLLDKLQKALRPKITYTVGTGAKGAGLSIEGQEASQDWRNDMWILSGLNPGAYKLRLAGKQPLTQTVAVNRGDMLLLEAANNPAGKLAMQRVVYSESDFPTAPSKENSVKDAFKDGPAREPWRFAILQNQLFKDQSVQMLATLEKQADPAEVTLRLPKPVKAWLEVSAPQEGGKPFVSRWSYQAGYPAPAYSLDVPLWPSRKDGSAPAQPVVKAWWSPDRLLPPGATVERGADFESFKGLAEKPLRVGEEDVVIESVQVEEHWVEVKPGVRGTAGQLQPLPCLVVRVRHAVGSPVWVQLRGLEPWGEEHRYYSDAGKYTALFWAVTADQAALALKGIDVYSLAAFKRDAEARKYTVELRNLYLPDRTDTRPVPPLIQAKPGLVEID
jgi:hypothetical protein